jgi:hypothetical protein
MVISGLSDAAQAEVDERDWTIAHTWAPYTRQDRFVVIAASPAETRSPTETAE